MADERHTPGTVTRRVHHFERTVAHPHRVAVGQLVIGRRRCLRFHSQPLALLHHSVVERSVGGMEIRGDTGRPNDVGHTSHVVQMRVRQPHRPKRPSLGLDPPQKQFCLFAGIHDYHVAQRRIGDEVTVFGKRPVGEADDLRRCQEG